MEIVKIGKKTWQNAVICQTCQKIFTANVFIVRYMLCDHVENSVWDPKRHGMA